MLTFLHLIKLLCHVGGCSYWELLVQVCMCVCMGERESKNKNSKTLIEAGGR